jgi:hypothetical protein
VRSQSSNRINSSCSRAKRSAVSIHHRVKEVLDSHAVDVDVEFRRELARLVSREAKTIEALPGALDSLRQQVGRPRSM